MDFHERQALVRIIPEARTVNLLPDIPTRGEDGVGTWTVIIKDGVENDITGTLVDWSITLWGEAIDAGKAKLLPLPGGNEAGGKDTATESVSTSTADVKTAELPTSKLSTVAEITGNPTNHVTRPVNSKPGDDDASTQIVTGLSHPP